MKKRILLIGISTFLAGLFFYYLGWSFSPGSYGKAEFYEFNIPEKELIEIINDVKKENSELELKSNNYTDYRDKFWYLIHFQYRDSNQIIKTWTRPKNKTATTFAFVSYKNGYNSGKWIDANEYFWWWKNSTAKNEFEERILEKIKEKLKKQKV